MIFLTIIQSSRTQGEEIDTDQIWKIVAAIGIVLILLYGCCLSLLIVVNNTNMVIMAGGNPPFAHETYTYTY